MKHAPVCDPCTRILGFTTLVIVGMLTGFAIWRVCKTVDYTECLNNASPEVCDGVRAKP